MATGFGKTRTVVSLVDVLLRHRWVKNILFLVDRNSLVTQAKRAFVNLLPDLSITNLCEDKENLTARAVFSTYQTMMGRIDDVRDKDGGKLFTIGHFDLIIAGGAHRSIYDKYQDIFNNFDAHFVGLTATPRDEIDKSTYSVFELETGASTYSYALQQAVEDEYLVDFRSLKTTLKFLSEGITYGQLSDEDKAQYEDTFADENGDLPESIDAGTLNKWVFNENTIRKVLDTLMTQGLRVNYGNKLGKSIIFAKKHRHAEKIYEVFNKNYPACVGWVKVIDNRTNYAQSAIDEFSDPAKLPQIAISADILDTGIDVRQRLRYVERFSKEAAYQVLTYKNTRQLAEVAPLLPPSTDEATAVQFDSLMYGIELAWLVGKEYAKARKDLRKKESLRRHRDEPVIVKLHGNQPLTEPDVKRLEDILRSEAGTKTDYEKEYGSKPLGKLVQEIVGLDINAAREVFSKYLNDAGLDRRQIYFVDQIVSYIAKNGMMKDLSVLRGAPFTDHGSVAEIFTDLSVWLGIRQVIGGINANAASSFEPKSCGANRSTALSCAGGAGIQTAPPE